jgi:hypothetical protein
MNEYEGALDRRRQQDPAPHCAPDAATRGFVTTEAAPAMRHAANAVGAPFFIARPFPPEGFGNALKRVLG